MANVTGATLQAVNAFYAAHARSIASHLPGLAAVLQAFVLANEDPSGSPNLAQPEPDDTSCVLAALGQPCISASNSNSNGDSSSNSRSSGGRGGGPGSPVLLLLLKTVKMLARKGANRQPLGAAAIPLLASVLDGQQGAEDGVAAEAANALLNLCYEASNVGLLLAQQQAVARLVAMLAHASPDVRANAAGALQSVCYQPQGRKKVRELGGVGALLHALSDTHPKVLQRAAGALHNLSSDAGAIRMVRTLGGIPALVALLGSSAPGVAGSAAGAIQNVSREVASRLIMRDLNAATALMTVLASSDVTAQVCAAGALLNILGPEIDAQEDGPQQRRAFGKLLALTMATAAMQEGVEQQLADWRQSAVVC